MDNLRNWSKSRSPSPGRIASSTPKPGNVSMHGGSGRLGRSKSPGRSGDLARSPVASQHGSDDQPHPDDDNDASGLNGSMDIVDEGDDGKARAAIEHIQGKIVRTKDLIKGEQNARDDNVNEYLKLASNADKQQIQRIKAVFEKKNQKSAQCIQQLQKKLDSYTKKLKELETRGPHHHHRQPSQVLRDVGHGLKHVGGNIRDGITGLSGSVMAKPKEFAHLIRNKFGSADNINALSRNGETDSLEEEKTHHGSATLPGGCSLGSAIKFTSEQEGSECSSVTSESMPGVQPTSPPSSTTHAETSPSIEALLTELKQRKHDNDKLRDKMETLKELFNKEIQDLNQSLQEERFRCDRLEEQVNDLTELHQNEVENLKTTISDMEEKVQYQSEERLRDIHEMLEACQTKISKMEHQQAQHQQYLTLEGLDNSNARALVVKLINVLLTVLQVVLLLVATAAGILMPFLRTRFRVLSTLALAVAVVVLVKRWPELLELSLPAKIQNFFSSSRNI